MKKLLSVLLAAMLLLSLAVPAFAASNAYDGEYTYEDIDPDVYDGSWWNVDDIFDLYLPDSWAELDPADYDFDDSCYYVFGEEGSDYIAALWYYDVDTVAEYFGQKFTSAAEMVDYLTAAGYEAFYYLLNDIEAAAFINAENDTVNVMISGSADGLFAFTFTCWSDEDYQPAVANMIWSISEHEEA